MLPDTVPYRPVRTVTPPRQHAPTRGYGKLKTSRPGVFVYLGRKRGWRVLFSPEAHGGCGKRGNLSVAIGSCQTGPAVTPSLPPSPPQHPPPGRTGPDRTGPCAPPGRRPLASQRSPGGDPPRSGARAGHVSGGGGGGVVS